MKNKSLALFAALSLAACTQNPYTGQSQIANTTLGVGAGAALGTGVGALVGSTTKIKTKKAMMIGAGVGALAGGAIGLYMDNQEAKLRQQLRSTGVSVSRVGDQIVLNMPSNIMFGSDQSNISRNFHPTLESVALVFNEYNNTRISVVGHTDSDGAAAYNRDLSQRRANAVARELTSYGVHNNRFRVSGMGEEQPIATNSSSFGKSENRRVEIYITPMG